MRESVPRMILSCRHLEEKDKGVGFLPLAVNGNLMRGLGRNHNLLRLNAVFLMEARTAPLYKLYSIDDKHPGMVRVSQGGTEILLEVWNVPLVGFADILQNEPDGLSIGK